MLTNNHQGGEVQDEREHSRWVSTLGFMDRHSIVPVSSQGTYGPVADIKCIVFAVKGVPAIPAVVVVLDQSRRVEQRKVAACLDRVLGSEVSVKRQDVVMLGVHWTRPAWARAS